jgi:hypothetical protein
METAIKIFDCGCAFREGEDRETISVCTEAKLFSALIYPVISSLPSTVQNDATLLPTTSLRTLILCSAILGDQLCDNRLPHPTLAL